MKARDCHLFSVAALLAVVAISTSANAVPMAVNLSSWTVEGSSSSWNLQNAPTYDSVLQTVNGSPTVFYGTSNAQNTAISGNIQVVDGGGDDDFIGFVLGFRPGDLTNAAADYILIDWKRGNQQLFNCTGSAGLAISRITGALGDDSGAWCHDSANNVNELARATNLGSTGWVTNAINAFEISFTSTNITVKVNGVEELNVNGSFNNGRVGFYNYSQADVNYSAIAEQATCGEPGLPPCPPTDMPEPGGLAGLAIFGLGLTAVQFVRRRRSG